MHKKFFPSKIFINNKKVKFAKGLEDQIENDKFLIIKKSELVKVLSEDNCNNEDSIVVISAKYCGANNPLQELKNGERIIVDKVEIENDHFKKGIMIFNL